MNLTFSRSLPRMFIACSPVRNYGAARVQRFAFKERHRSNKVNENYPHIESEALARSIAKYVHESISSEAYVFEANPGPGVLSKALLESGVQHLRVFAKEEHLTSTLKELSSSHPGHLEIIPENLMLLPRLDYFDGADKTDVFFHGIKKRSWQEAPPITIVAVLTERIGVNFMRCMLAKLSVMSSFFSFGRCQFFVIIAESEHRYITAEPKKNLEKYRASTMLYNMLFDIKIIGEIPASCLSSDHMPRTKRAKWQASNLYFAHFIPKIDIFNSVAPLDKLPDLNFFVRYHMSRRTTYVIRQMEKWVPSCGSRLIFEGMKVFTRFGDLSPSEMLRVFQLFSSWPEYEGSGFKHLSEQFYHQYFHGVSLIEDDKELDEGTET